MSHALQFKDPDCSENFLYLWIQDHWILNCLCSLNQISLIITFCSSPAEGHQVEIIAISAPSGCAFMSGYPICSLPPECHHLHPTVCSCIFLCLCFHWHVAMWKGSGPGQEKKHFFCTVSFQWEQISLATYATRCPPLLMGRERNLGSHSQGQSSPLVLEPYLQSLLWKTGLGL